MTARADRHKFNVGDRVRWDGETIAGTITAIEIGGQGWPRYRIAWDDGAPEWWSPLVSCATSNLVKP